jgi:hypothetical protein
MLGFLCACAFFIFALLAVIIFLFFRLFDILQFYHEESGD